MTLRSLGTSTMTTTREYESTRLRVVSSKSLTEQEIRRVRARLGELVEQYESQFQASAKLGISQQTISNILRGASVGRDVAKRIAAHDRVPVEQLLGPAVPQALEEVLRGGHERWEAYVVAGVRKAAIELDGAERMSNEDWEALLDRFQTALAPILREIGRRRGR